MKKQTHILKKALILLLSAVLVNTTAFSATFTAVASGSWNNSATWGGTAPPFDVTSDQVVIPSGMSVSTSSTVTINGASASLTVLGTLTDAGADTLSIGAGVVTGSGSVSMTNVLLNTGAVLAFSGTLTTNTLINWSAGFSLYSNLTVSQNLVLAGGNLNLQTGGTLTMSANGTITVSGGLLALTSGTLTLTNSYNVVYTTASTSTGLEVSGSGLHNVTVNVATAGGYVTLSGDLTVNGTLSLMNGSLTLNGHSLTLHGDLASGGSGVVSAAGTSNITIATANSLSGTLNFSATAYTVNNLTMNIANSSGMLNVGTDFVVNGTLTLTSGLLNIADWGLDMGPGATISGGSSSSYVIATPGGGYLGFPLMAGAANWTTYPVGTSTHYAPVAAILNAGSASGSVDVYVTDGVDAQGTSGVDLSLSQPAVDVTYYVEPDSVNTTNLSMKLMWSAAMEVNAFNRDSAYISHFTVGHWDLDAIGSATAAGGGIYTMERDNITTFSPFAVFGNNASTTGIQDISAEGLFVISPVPASDNLSIRNVSDGEPCNMDIIDISGQKVASYTLSGGDNNIPLGSLSEGNYFLKIYNAQTSIVRRFVKIE